MQNRRDFIRMSLAASVGLAAGNTPNAFAGPKALPSGIVYTADDPGQWSKKVKGHAPEISVQNNKVTIVTNHSMSKKHYIVRHTLISADGKVLGAKTFYPSDKKAVSVFDLPAGHTSRLYAASFCNLHDFWVTELAI